MKSCKLLEIIKHEVNDKAKGNRTESNITVRISMELVLHQWISLQIVIKDH